jgi:protein involved in temperature-dependent protein secretion
LWTKDADEKGGPKRVYLPALAPLTWKHPDDASRLGRLSVLENEEDGEAIPFGAKLLLCDADQIPLLDVRTIEALA